METYLATLAANDEGDDDTTKRLFRGLIDGEALRWYNAQPQATRDNWVALKAAFEQEFREIGADSRIIARLNQLRMKASDTLRSYVQRVYQLIGKLSIPPPNNLQMEWFIAGLPELLDFEVRKVDPWNLGAVIDVAKKCERAARLSGRWTEKRPRKKVTFVEDEDSDDDAVEEEKVSRPSSSKTQQNQITKVVKDEMQTIKAALEDVKIQMADLKKGRRVVPTSRTNVWCTRCKKEGHFAHDCQADWRMI